MSTWFDEQIACPACGVEQTAKLARGVHVSRAPEAREQIFHRTFHRISCKACRVQFVAKRHLVYTDMDRKHWMQVASAEERPRWPELEKLTSEVFERAFTGSPLAAEMRDTFRVRLVFGMEELREKLVIWRAGLVDSVVECAKLQLVSQDPTLALANHLLVEEADDSSAELVAYDAEMRPINHRVISGSLLDSMHDAAEQLQRYLPELFGGEFVSCYRLLGHRYRSPTP